MTTQNIATMVRRMTPTRYAVKEAAELVGKSPDTLVRWRRTGLYVPSDQMRVGKLTVYLYTDRDIENMKRLARTIRPGRRRA